jgi:GAF domain-containing protein
MKEEIMIKELENLSLTMDLITKDDAKEIIRTVNGALPGLLKAHIIDVRWKEEAVEGVFLNSFSSIDLTQRGTPSPYLIKHDSNDDPTGVWTWVYKNRKPLWIEEIKIKDLKQPVRNEATGKEIESRYLNFFELTDSIMAIPLTFRDTVWGIYSVELPISGKLSPEIRRLLERLSKPMASIIWKADEQEFHQSQTRQAIDLFDRSIPESINDSVIMDLEKLGLALGLMTKRDADQIIRAVNTKFAAMVEAHIIDVRWKEEAEGGGKLNSFSSFDQTMRGTPKPYLIKHDSNDDPTGVWTWVYENRKPLWIEGIKGKDLKKAVKNEATEDDIEPRYLNFFESTDSIMAIPLTFRDTVWGIYSVELPTSGKLTQEIKKLMEWIARPLATIVWKADAQEFKQKQRAEAVRLFCTSWKEYEVEAMLTKYRTGFIARPFDPKFNVVEDCITETLENKDICAEHYKFGPGKETFVIKEIMDKVRSSHFGIVDITNCNHNVMLELGMMMVLGKRFILLRRHDDATRVPFDISSYHYFEYEEKPGPEIRLKDPGTNQYEPIKQVLEDFVKRLEDDPAFLAAKPCTKK